MTDRVVDLAAGTQVWFEGAVWVVRELGPSAVTLSCSQSGLPPPAVVLECVDDEAVRVRQVRCSLYSSTGWADRRATISMTVLRAGGVRHAGRRLAQNPPLRGRPLVGKVRHPHAEDLDTTG